VSVVMDTNIDATSITTIQMGVSQLDIAKLTQRLGVPWPLDTNILTISNLTVTYTAAPDTSLFVSATVGIPALSAVGFTSGGVSGGIGFRKSSSGTDIYIKVYRD
jgi:hypothetical protein